MKKIRKKLVVKKKTISRLTSEQQNQVTGGEAPVDRFSLICIDTLLVTAKTYCPDSQGNHC